jgi:hypothetical protein
LLDVQQVTQIPWFDYVWNKNPIAALIRVPSAQPILNIVREKIIKRQNIIEEYEHGLNGDNPADFLSCFMQVQKENHKNIPSW